MIQLGLTQLPRRRVEVRESYTNQIIGSLIHAAVGVGDGSALAVVETASRWWSSGLASASVRPDNSVLRSVSPTVLASIGRSLCRFGESLHIIDVSGGRLRLIACGSWGVSGSDDAASWTYRATLSGPSTSRTITLPAESVLHVRYAADPARPWAGRSPLRLAASTAKVAGLLETAAAAEFGFTQSQMLTPRRNQSDYGLADSLAPETIQKIVDAFAKHVSTGAFVIPEDVQVQRLGPSPPDSFGELRDKFEASLLSAHGIPPSLVAAQANSGAMRESFRQVLHSLLKPLGALVIQEIQEKLDPAAALSFDSLRAGDVTGMSRAFGSLVTGGLTPQSAAAVVGLDGVEVSAT